MSETVSGTPNLPKTENTNTLGEQRGKDTVVNYTQKPKNGLNDRFNDNPQNTFQMLARGETHTETVSTEQLIAEANGVFYDDLLDTYLDLTITPEARREHLQEEVNKLPGETMKKVYQSGVDRIENRLTRNHLLLENAHMITPEERIRFLLNNATEQLVINDGASPELFQEFIERIPFEDITFSEHAPGVFILEAGENALATMNEYGFMSSDTLAIHFKLSFKDDTKPNFLVVPKNVPQNSTTTKKAALKHEFSHFVREQLVRDNFIAQPKDMDDSTWQGFNYFADEVAAYLIQYQGVADIIRTQHLLKTRNKTIFREA